ncbi:MAG: alpha-amylase [Lachnospiraceae bacterium]|nr:alpha-amylase [Lachnospiraceae bacterium]
MGAVRVPGGVQFTAALSFRNTLKLFIHSKDNEIIDHVSMSEYRVAPGLYSCVIEGEWNSEYSYSYEVDGKSCPDPFMSASTARRAFGDGEAETDRAKLPDTGFDWEGDRALEIPFNNVIAYQLHVRGFTAHSSSHVRNRGRFLGIVEKLDHLQKLGVNQIVLMPCYEFDEVMRPGDNQSMENIDYRMETGDGAPLKINFWGFTSGRYYMPKAAYSSKDPVNEFKSMVKECHRAGIEVIMRFYFPDHLNKAFIPDILRFWAREYHVDGFFLMGSDIPMEIIAADVFLRDRKIYNTFFNKDAITCKKYGYNRNMAFVNSDFMNCCRKFLKSDENQLSEFCFRQRLNPPDVHVVNYITDYYGFTLNDLVTYDYKHNESNREDNSDGENFNYSWNCGAEGPSRKRSVLSLRMKQMKNALTFLLLAQGTPMLTAGDEFMNTQNGNNNPYCQDNEIGWVVWKDSKQAAQIYEFTEMLIKLRREHPILHPEREFRIMDYASCGFPDLSYHGDMAWSPRYDNHLRHIGIMICGKYARLTKIKEDDFFYIAYNMHWEDHTFALPKLPKGLVWTVKYLTCDDSAGRIVHKTIGERGDTVTVPDRTVAVFISTEDKAAQTAAVDTKKKGNTKDAGR